MVQAPRVQSCRGLNLRNLGDVMFFCETATWYVMICFLFLRDIQGQVHKFEYIHTLCVSKLNVHGCRLCEQPMYTDLLVDRCIYCMWHVLAFTESSCFFDKVPPTLTLNATLICTRTVFLKQFDRQKPMSSLTTSPWNLPSASGSPRWGLVMAPDEKPLWGPCLFEEEAMAHGDAARGWYMAPVYDTALLCINMFVCLYSHV